MSKKEFEKIPLEFDTPVPFYDLGVSWPGLLCLWHWQKAIRWRV